jgi:D-glycero-alpha-D-manno-heptose 1-phosphate guanylyltransferase
MIDQCIILAGGLGTRLRTAVPDLPKCMAPVNNRPFVEYVIDYFQQQGVQHFIFALGYKSEAFETFLSSKLSTANYQLSIESEPLGTGGAIQLACSKAHGKNVLVTNGDTLFKAGIAALSDFHTSNQSDCTLPLKPMHDFDRYGVVALNESSRIESFKEKQYYAEGLINGGLYALNVGSFMRENLPEKFSFEKDYLEKYFTTRKMFGLRQDAYFIDIGIPEDYERAQREL